MDLLGGGEGEAREGGKGGRGRGVGKSLVEKVSITSNMITFFN